VKAFHVTTCGAAKKMSCENSSKSEGADKSISVVDDVLKLIAASISRGERSHKGATKASG